MSRYGAWLLKKLKIRYCDWGGSSAGMRDFVASDLPAFRAANPQIEIETVVRRNRHPVVEGTFANAAIHPVDVKNLSARGVAQQVAWLRSGSGRRATARVPPRRQLNRTESIQGRWTVDTFASAGARSEAAVQTAAANAGATSGAAR